MQTNRKRVQKRQSERENKSLDEQTARRWRINVSSEKKKETGEKVVKV